METLANRTAFIITSAELIPQILKTVPLIFHIYLIGEFKFCAGEAAEITIIDAEKLTLCLKGRNYFRDPAGFIAEDIIKRGLINITCEYKNKVGLSPESIYIDAINILNESDCIQKNTVQNLGRAEYFADFLENKFLQRPCILVGAGPSIQKNIHVLKTVADADKALIIACGRGLCNLVENGITPHFLIILDHSPEMYDVIRPYIQKISNKTILASSLAGNHQIVEEFKGIKIFFMSRDDDLKHLTGSNNLFAGGASVTIPALIFAEFIGCEPIIFAGQDLNLPAYEPAAITIEELISFSRRCMRHMTFINATEGGRGIRGADHLSLQDVADKYLKDSFQFQIVLPTQKIKQTQNSIEAHNTAYQQFYAERKEFIKLLISNKRTEFLKLLRPETLINTDHFQI